MMISAAGSPLDQYKIMCFKSAMLKDDTHTTMRDRLAASILVVASLYRDATGQTKTVIGRACARDPAFFSRIEKRGFQVNTYDETMQWFSDNWPPATKWPRGISRPPPVSVQSIA